MRKRHIVQSMVGLAFGLALCVALAGHVQIAPAMLADLAARFDPLLALAALLVTLAMIESGARKWAYLDRHMDGHQPRPHAYYLRHFIWQNWLAQILPTTVALIAGRALVTHVTEQKNWRRGLRSGFVDQLSELLVILAFIPATLWQLSAGIGFLPWFGAGLFTLLLSAVLGGLLLPRYVLPVVILWSLLRIILITLRLVLGAQAFALPIAAAVVAYATPLATLTVLIPLTPGNLGLSEWGWTYALSLWQVDVTTAALYALSFRLLVFVLQSLLLLALPVMRAR